MNSAKQESVNTVEMAHKHENSSKAQRLIVRRMPRGRYPRRDSLRRSEVDAVISTRELESILEGPEPLRRASTETPSPSNILLVGRATTAD